MSTTSILDIVDRAPTLYAARQNGRAISIHMLGAPGCGKTALARYELPNVMEEHYFPAAEPAKREPYPMVSWSRGGLVATITERLATMDSADVRGFPMPIKDKVSGEYATHWVVPSLVNAERWCYEQGAKIVILLLDEFAQAGNDVQKVAAPILLDGEVGSFAFNKRTWVWAASNRSQDNAGANRVLSIINNRVINYDVFMPVDRWLAWAKGQGMIPVMSGFIEFRSDLLADVVPTKEGPFLTFRSMMQAVSVANAMRHAKKITDPMVIPDDDFTRETIAGVIGAPACTELYTYAANAAHLPKLADIIRDPLGAMIPSGEHLATQYAAAAMLVQGAEPGNIGKLWQYAERLIPDLQVKTANGLLENKALGGVLWNAPTFSAWLASHRALVTATFSL